jgi:hypothetical protein
MSKKPLVRSLIIGVFLISALLISQEYRMNGGVARASVAVPGTAFHSDRNWQDFDYDLTEGSVIGGRGPFLFAPVYFSPGYKKVTKIIMKCYDNNDSADLSVVLYRKNFNTNQLEFVAVVHSGMSFQSTNIETMEEDANGPLAKIDNDLYAWYLMCEFDQWGGDPMELHQIIINYSK